MNDAKTTTLFGGLPIKVTLLDGSQAEFTVRQLSLGDYPKAKKFLDADDEIGLTAFICGHPPDWANNIAPESYEELHRVSGEVNAKGFFSWLPRQQRRERERQQHDLQLVGMLSPDQMIQAVKTGIQMQSTSPSGAPKPRA